MSLFKVMFLYVQHEASQLEQENKKLRKEVDDLRRILIDLETRNGSKILIINV